MKKVTILILLMAFSCKSHRAVEKSTVNTTDKSQEKSVSLISNKFMDSLQSVLNGKSENLTITQIDEAEYTPSPVYNRSENNLNNNSIKTEEFDGNWQLIPDSITSNKKTFVDKNDTTRRITTIDEGEGKISIIYDSGKKRIINNVISDSAIVKKTKKTTIYSFTKIDTTKTISHITSQIKDSNTTSEIKKNVKTIQQHKASERTTNVLDWKQLAVILIIGLIVGGIVFYIIKKKITL